MPDPVGIATEDFYKHACGEFPQMNGLIGSSTGQPLTSDIYRNCAYTTTMPLKHFTTGPTCEIPQTQVCTFTATDKGLAIRGKCQRPDTTAMSPQDVPKARLLAIPDPHGLIIAGAGESLAIRAKAHTAYPVGVL